MVAVLELRNHKMQLPHTIEELIFNHYIYNFRQYNIFKIYLHITERSRYSTNMRNYYIKPT